MSKSNPIVPHLWFDKDATEATEFYTLLFPRSRVTNTTVIHDVPSPSGDSRIITFELAGQPFMAIDAGPIFKINPSVSFFLNFDPSRDKHAEAQLDAAWDKLSAGGTALMPLGEYPFSKHYGWVQDRFGVSWQLILTNPAGDPRPFIVPSLLFVGNVCGRAEEAVDFYRSVFKNSAKGNFARYGKDQAPDREGTVAFGEFRIGDQWFAVMDSAQQHDFAFTEAVSFIVSCDDQKEIDYYWDKLSVVPEAEQCGWLKDKFGLSWQITPAVMESMMSQGTDEQRARVTQAFLKMKKFNIAQLEAAFRGE